MSENTETEPPVKKSRIEKIAGPALFAGCFIIWPATNLACTYLGYKTIDKQLALETLKAVSQK